MSYCSGQDDSLITGLELSNKRFLMVGNEEKDLVLDPEVANNEYRLCFTLHWCDLWLARLCGTAGKPRDWTNLICCFSTGM